jgi:hypothetical protein
MGLSLDAMDQYHINHEPNDNGIERRIDKYTDNLFDFLAVYETPERFRFRFDYSNYDLYYAGSINDYRNRNDNSFSFYVFYRLKPKTSVFVEYDFADIEYVTNTDSDSTEDRYFAGFDWNVTAKTKGRVKLGYMQKNFKSSNVNNQDDFSLEIQAEHNFTPKRALKLIAFRRFNESSFIDSPSSLSTGGSISWLQRFTDKWSATLEFSYSRDEYNGPITIFGVTDERHDDIFSVAPALRYKPRDWLIVDLAYIYASRDSNFDIFDYVKNSVFLRVNISM